MKKSGLEELPHERPGDRIYRRSTRSRQRLRQVRDVSLIHRVVHDIMLHTPFIPMFLVLVLLWLLFGAGMYALEHNTSGAAMKSYGEALWWALASVETMGTPYEPITSGGRILGGIWAVLGVMVFWGTIIASVTAYFANRKKQPSTRMIETIQFNLGEIESLSASELNALKQATVSTIDAQIEKNKA